MLMLTGAIVAGATDLTYSLPGYIWVSICVVSTAMYLLLIRLLKDSTGTSVNADMLHRTAQMLQPKYQQFSLCGKLCC